MFIIHGVYHWWPKRVAFRNDYCLSCQAASRSFAIRTFDVGHIFWIPVLPVGFWKHWQCTRCHSEPHTSPGTRPFFKWTGVCLLALLAVISWVEPVEPPDEWVNWLFRIGAPLGGVVLLVNVLRTPRTLSLRKALKSVTPAADILCPFCASPLLAGPRWFCSGCGVLRY